MDPGRKKRVALAVPAPPPSPAHDDLTPSERRLMEPQNTFLERAMLRAAAATRKKRLRQDHFYETDTFPEIGTTDIAIGSKPVDTLSER